MEREKHEKRNGFTAVPLFMYSAAGQIRTQHLPFPFPAQASRSSSRYASSRAAMPSQLGPAFKNS